MQSGATEIIRLNADHIHGTFIAGSVILVNPCKLAKQLFIWYKAGGDYIHGWKVKVENI